MKKIVVVDTGIDINNKVLMKNVVGGITLDKKDNQYIVDEYKNNKSCINDNIGHGSAIAGIIIKHNPDVELYIVKLFNEYIFADENKLVFILNYILYNLDFDIVNLSLGLLSVSGNKLEKICDKYNKAQKIIISAFDNNGSLSFPAVFNCVIGVTSDSSCTDPDNYYYLNNEYINICAKGARQRVFWKNGNQILSSGNSYACAHFTGILSNFKKPENWMELNELIKNNSSCILSMQAPQVSCSVSKSPTFRYKKVILFPFNKEIQNVVNFSEKIDFEIVGVFDLKYSGKVGATTNSLLKTSNNNNYLIKSLSDIDWESFDTIILGHITELINLSHNVFNIKEFLATALEHEKNIYSFDDIWNDVKEYSNATTRVYIPRITQDDVYRMPFGKLYRQDKPVLGIFGTSSKQGKFTLQLKIRYNLLERGYKLCQVGTEPSSLLFGMDLVYPNGYNSTVSIMRDNAIFYLNQKIFEYSRNADLVIVGGQSGVVLREEGNISSYDYTQLEFIYATLPDATILCINDFDNIDIVIRAKKFLEAVSGCKVIAAVMFPFYYSPDDILQQKLIPMSEKYFNENSKVRLEEVLDIPLYYINNDNQLSMLCDNIIDYFS